jgi:CelD/BcsL family acetyltransferase involved in cellulose biosynthesis
MDISIDKKSISFHSAENNKRKALDIRIISNKRGFQLLREEWQELAEKNDGFIYQTFEWNWIWWKYFGAGKKLHIMTLRDDKRLVGIIPLFWDTISILNWPFYSCLRFIGSRVSQPSGEALLGSHCYSDYLDVIIHPDYQKKAVFNVISYFEQAKLPFHQLMLDEIPENSCLWKYLLPALDKKQYGYSVERSSVCPIVKLNGNWEKYLQSLSKKSRYNNRKSLRQIDEEDEKGFHIEESKNIKEFESLFNVLVEMHQDRWNKQAIPGTFAKTRIYNFNKEVTKTFYKKGWSQIRIAKPVKSVEDIIAVDLFFKYQNRTYMVHRAMNYYSHFSKEGPGNVLLSLTLKKAANSGKDAVDFLRGEHTYKFRYANTSTKTHRITIENPLKQSAGAIKAAKLYSVMRERAMMECCQFNLFMQRKTQEKGLIGYLKFLEERMARKISSAS